MVARVLIAGGCGLLGVSAALYIVFDRAIRADLALSLPGEHGFGGAVLAMMHGPRILATAVVGFLIVLLGMFVATVRRVWNAN